MKVSQFIFLMPFFSVGLDFISSMTQIPSRFFEQPAFAEQSTFPALVNSSHLQPGIHDNAKDSPIIDLIDQSTSTLDMEIYEMDDPKVINAIRNAVKRGVTVHIVKEPNPVGNGCKVFVSQNSTAPSPNSDSDKLKSSNCEDQRQLVDDVNRSGGLYVPFNKSELCDGHDENRCLEHGKIVVSDSKLAMISSGNFNTTSLCDLDYSPVKCNRDYSYLIDEPDLVGGLKAVIEKDLIGEKYDLQSIMKPDVSARLTVGPHSLDPLISFINSAKERIQIENQYLKDPTMNAALIEAAKRGVKVQITVSSVCSFGKPKPSEVARVKSTFGAFDQAGISTKMFNKNILINGKPGYLHAKAMIVDGQRAWVGSVNGSTQALTINREFGIFFDNSKDVNNLMTILNSDYNDPNEETWQQSLQCAEHN